MPQAQPSVRFSPDLVRRVGPIGAVLVDFLDSQIQTIQEDLAKTYPGISPQTVQRLLNTLVTLEGTKRPMHKDDVHLLNIEAPAIRFCLDRLEKARILRLEDDQYELAHDTLAAALAPRRSAAEVALLEVRKLVNDRRSAYASTQPLLNRNEVALIANYETKLRDEEALDAEAWRFVEDSRREIKRQRRNRILLVSAIIAILSVSAVVAWQGKLAAQQSETQMREQKEIALAAEQKAKDALQQFEQEQGKRKEEEQKNAKANYERFLALAKAAENRSDYTGALSEYDKALSLAETLPGIIPDGGAEARAGRARCAGLANSKGLSETLIKEGDQLLAKGSDFLPDALVKYRQAERYDPNNPAIRRKIESIEGRLEAAFANLVQAGDVFKRANACELALAKYRQAAKIKPNDGELQRKIRECEK